LNSSQILIKIKIFLFFFPKNDKPQSSITAGYKHYDFLFFTKKRVNIPWYQVKNQDICYNKTCFHYYYFFFSLIISEPNRFFPIFILLLFFIGQKLKEKMQKNNENNERIRTAASLADDESDAIFQDFLDNFVLESHYRKRREVRLRKWCRTWRATRRRRWWRFPHFQNPRSLTSSVLYRNPFFCADKERSEGKWEESSLR
jgi:hypothetical protein